MTGQDFTDTIDALVVDLQTKGKGQTVNIALRGADNITNDFRLSSDVNGIVNDGELKTLRSAILDASVAADGYSVAIVPVQMASEAFKLAAAPFMPLADAASLARKNYNDAILADAPYQAAKTALDAARNDPAYVASLTAYRNLNVSENFGNLGDAKGKYVGVPNG